MSRACAKMVIRIVVNRKTRLIVYGENSPWLFARHRTVCNLTPTVDNNSIGTSWDAVYQCADKCQWYFIISRYFRIISSFAGNGKTPPVVSTHNSNSATSFLRGYKSRKMDCHRNEPNSLVSFCGYRPRGDTWWSWGWKLSAPSTILFLCSVSTCK